MALCSMHRDVPSVLRRIDPVSSGKYNMVVIGAGAGGLVTAAGAAGVGARVALIEKNLLGMRVSLCYELV